MDLFKSRSIKPKNPHVKRAKKAKRQAEAIERNKAFQALSLEEKRKRNPRKVYVQG